MRNLNEEAAERAGVSIDNLIALPLIGDLASWIHPTGRGVKDRTADYLR